jgi:hypothetical protein
VIARALPQLSHLQDVADFVLGGGDASDSEGDELVDTKVALPAPYVGPGECACRRVCVCRRSRCAQAMRCQQHAIRIAVRCGVARSDRCVLVLLCDRV